LKPGLSFVFVFNELRCIEANFICWSEYSMGGERGGRATGCCIHALTWDVLLKGPNLSCRAGSTCFLRRLHAAVIEQVCLSSWTSIWTNREENGMWWTPLVSTAVRVKPKPPHPYLQQPTSASALCRPGREADGGRAGRRARGGRGRFLLVRRPPPPPPPPPPSIFILFKLDILFNLNYNIYD
jgi:hypothetical protein